MNDPRRITLVNLPPLDSRDWDCSLGASTRIILVRTVAILEHALDELDRDVERVIVDRGATAAEGLHLLSHLPAEFHGDVLIILNDGSGFLSARARGDGYPAVGRQHPLVSGGSTGAPVRIWGDTAYMARWRATADYLYELGAKQDSNWKAYLMRLQQAGKSRDP